MSNRSSFYEGASEGFNQFYEVLSGNKDMSDAMKDIKDCFENDHESDED